MKRSVLMVLGLLVISTSAFAQTPVEDPIEKALGPAPCAMKEDATVIKWKPDFTYDTLRKGTKRSSATTDNNKQGGAWIMNAGTTTAHVMIPGS